MTLEEAIKELEDHSELILVAKNPGLRNAMRLGIEALKRLQEGRKNGHMFARKKLLGETYIPRSVSKLPSDEE